MCVHRQVYHNRTHGSMKPSLLPATQNSLQDGLGHLPALREIHVKDNALTSLPIDLCQTQSLRILDVNINPLRMPPLEIVERGLRSIFDFLSRLWRCQTTQVFRGTRGRGGESGNAGVLEMWKCRGSVWKCRGGNAGVLCCVPSNKWFTRLCSYCHADAHLLFAPDA